MKKTLLILTSVVSLSTNAQIISTLAGGGSCGSTTDCGDGAAATSAKLDQPKGVTSDASGNIYIADYFNNRIRMVSTTGTITTVAGTGFGAGSGSGAFSGDGGLATAAKLYHPTGVAFDASGNLYISDYTNNRIRMVSASTGSITTVAGTGTSGFSGDAGAATAAKISFPTGIACDLAGGNLYFSDSANHRIRKVVLSSGIISTFAGTGVAGYSGDGGAATSAKINQPTGLACDASGNLYISDYRDHRIRKVTPAGVISTLAGNGTPGFSGDGAAGGSAQLYFPNGVGCDISGRVFIADYSNHRIRVVNAAGVIASVAGNSSPGFAGDGGQANVAQLNKPSGVCADPNGNIFIGDNNNNRVRKVTAAAFGINEVNLNGAELIVYPNPASTIMNIEVRTANKTNCEVHIIDILGNDVKNEMLNSATGSLQINVSDLKSGVYFVKVKTEQGVATKKVVVQR